MTKSDKHEGPQDDQKLILTVFTCIKQAEEKILYISYVQLK